MKKTVFPEEKCCGYSRYRRNGIRDTRIHINAYIGKDTGNKEVAFIVTTKIKHIILDFEAVTEYEVSDLNQNSLKSLSLMSMDPQKNMTWR